jgi:transposase
MAKAYDRDLRARVAAAMEAGASNKVAAERFGIGKATAGAWARLKRATGDVAPKKQGQPRGSKLDPHADFIFALVDERVDISLAEIAERLLAERSIRVVPATIWYFFQRRGWTFKKRPRTLPSRTEKMFKRRVRLGSTRSSTSIRNA